MTKEQLRNCFTEFRYLASEKEPNILSEYVKYDEVRNALLKDYPSDDTIWRIIYLSNKYLTSKVNPNVSLVEYIKDNF